MPFLTKVDFSNNRQIKQYPETLTVLSGATQFGVPFSYLPTGVDTTTSAVTLTYHNIISTFSGNSGTTVYTWYNPLMELAIGTLSAITPSISAVTQTGGPSFSAVTSGTSIDGYNIVLTYTGVTFDITPTNLADLGGGAYSGSGFTNTLEILFARALDFTGSTIWVDVSGITRTNDLTISSSPLIGGVWTCVDSAGKGGWAIAGGGVWSAGTGTAAIAGSARESIASGNYSTADGYRTRSIGAYSHTEGFYTTASGSSSHAEGGLTTANGFYSHTEGANTITNDDAAHAEGQGSVANGYASHAEGSSITYGSYSHSEGYSTTAGGSYSHSEGYGCVASGTSSHTEGSGTTALGVASHAGGSLSVASGLTSFVHGNNSIAGGRSTIVLGDGITGTTNNYTYVESLNIKTIGSSAFVNDIRIDGNGNLTTNTSDRRLKENITPIKNALNKIKAMQGVTYVWKDKEAGGNVPKLGFIAQEIEKIEPLLVFTNKNDGYKGIHIDGIIPLLIEGIKELLTGDTKSTYIETQTILAEDNNIHLNYSGNTNSAVNGGIRVLHALGENESADFTIDADGNWVTNTSLKSKELIIPNLTPNSSSDIRGSEGALVWDDNFLYVKTKSGWKRTSLENF